MMWCQQQTLENISKNQAEYMAELRDIKGKQQELYENNDKFYNQVRQEQKEMVQEIQQIKNYQIYDNIDHKRPMFKGLLKSDLQLSNPAPPPSSSNDPKDPPK
ncbi:hypothetical protein PIB30_097974 [Stylosanthes scabra]|uniref:Uncharacterized protein n=1 Tax=Stylosanthes scabra TaxID=79078 RepID=A0ABU6SXP2_9FABA|nr:hypothetical protein [Stylosanthes scabra]